MFANSCIFTEVEDREDSVLTAEVLSLVGEVSIEMVRAGVVVHSWVHLGEPLTLTRPTITRHRHGGGRPPTYPHTHPTTTVCIRSHHLPVIDTTGTMTWLKMANITMNITVKTKCTQKDTVMAHHHREITTTLMNTNTQLKGNILLELAAISTPHQTNTLGEGPKRVDEPRHRKNACRRVAIGHHTVHPRLRGHHHHRDRSLHLPVVGLNGGHSLRRMSDGPGGPLRRLTVEDPHHPVR